MLNGQLTKLLWKHPFNLKLSLAFLLIGRNIRNMFAIIKKYFQQLEYAIYPLVDVDMDIGPVTYATVR